VEVTHPITVTILERFDVELVDDGVLKPGRVAHLCSKTNHTAHLRVISLHKSAGKPPHSRSQSPPSQETAVPEKSNNDEIERLHRRREELKKQSEEIEEKLEKLQNELKKVTGRIVLPDDASRKSR